MLFRSEGEAKYELTEKIEGTQGTTEFYLELTPPILEVYNSWDKFFIVGKEPFYEDDRVKIYPHTGTLKIYKQGIFIKALEKEDSLFCYDIKDASINELREYQGALEYDLSRIIAGIQNPKVIQYYIENLKEGMFEYTIGPLS